MQFLCWKLMYADITSISFLQFYFLAIVQFSDIIVPQRCCNSILSVRSAQLQPRGTLDEIVLFHFSQFTKWVSTSSRLHRIYDAPDQRWELAELRVLPSLQLSPVGHRYSRTVSRTQRRRPAEPGKKLTVGLNWLRQMSHFPTAQLVRPTFFFSFFLHEREPKRFQSAAITNSNWNRSKRND